MSNYESWGPPPPAPQQPPKPKKMSGVAWVVAIVTGAVGIMLGAGINGGSDPGAEAAAAPDPATPGTCLQALDLAEAGEVTPGQGTWNHVASDCRSRAAGGQAPEGPPSNGGQAEAAEEPAPAPEPEPEPEPEAAGFGDGVHQVGADIQPGTYRTDGPADSIVNNCYFARLKDTSGEFDAIIANNNLAGPGTVTIAPTDGAFESLGCQPWVAQ